MPVIQLRIFRSDVRRGVVRAVHRCALDVGGQRLEWVCIAKSVGLSNYGRQRTTFQSHRIPDVMTVTVKVNNLPLSRPLEVQISIQGDIVPQAVTHDFSEEACLQFPIVYCTHQPRDETLTVSCHIDAMADIAREKQLCDMVWNLLESDEDVIGPMR